MREVVFSSSSKDVLRNLLHLHDYASGPTEQRDFHFDRLYNAEHQVYYLTSEGPIFAPVKWCGARDNSLADYEWKKNYTAGYYQQALRKIGFREVLHGSADYDNLYADFIAFLDGFKFKKSVADLPHSNSRPRTFWAFPSSKQGKKRVYPDEVAGGDYPEGATRKVLVNAYERNSEARLACIAHYGWSCQACGLNLEKRYGLLGAEYIHVHHLRPLSELKKEYRVDPIKDLRPVCPNCHAMIHRSDPMLSVEALKELIASD